VRVAEAALDGLDPEVAASRARGPRSQVFVHVEADESAHMHLGPALPDALRRYLLCDATVRAVIERDGELLGFSPAAPTVDWRMRLYIEDRDGGCGYPGCTACRWLHIHHIVHREDGGETVAENLIAQCPHHHRIHHKGGFTIEGNPEHPETLVFRNRFGMIIGPPKPERPLWLPPGAATATFTPPSGERLDSRWITWS
jgi:hypothetical protein